MESSSKPSPPPAAAPQYGNYVIMQDAEGKQKLLGTGTFGRTYLARHHFLETQAALKVINERFAREAAARARFLQEGRALVRLDHRHIARLLDFGETQGNLFYAMEYCAGGDLAHRVQSEGPLPLEAWLRVARQLTSALDCCHRAGFIHRDLKPSNVMLASKGHPLVVKLIDFGLVHGEHNEGAPAALGTPLYASPEQLREQAVDARSDLFSLGVTLWHLAIGAPPETGNSAQIIASRLSSESYAPRIPPHLPPTLRDLLARLVEKDVVARPASASDVLATLQQAAQELGLSGAPEPGSTGATGAEEEQYATIVAPTIQPLPVQDARGISVLSEFAPGASAPSQPTGTNRFVTGLPPNAGNFWLHQIHPEVVEHEALFRKLRVTAASLPHQEAPDCLQPLTLRAYGDATVLLFPAPVGLPLADQLKMHGKCALNDVLPLLRRIGDTSDRLLLGGLPGIELRTSCIYLSPNALSGGENFQLSLVPRLLTAAEALPVTSAAGHGPEGTMSPELLEEETGASQPVLLFARLIYRLVAGRECVAAASATPQAYVPVAELSETNNRLLSHIIAGRTVRATCAALLAELQGLGAGGGSLNRSSTQTRPPSGTASGSGTQTMGAGNSRAATLTSAAITQPLAPKEPPRQLDPLPHTEPEPSRKMHPALLGVLVLFAAGWIIFLLSLGGYWLFGGKKPGGGGGQTGSPTAGTGEVLPKYSVLQVDGDKLSSMAWTVAGSPAHLKSNGEKTELVMPSFGQLPVEIVGKLPGYQNFLYQVTKRSDLDQPLAVVLVRAKGTLTITRPPTCDYAVLSASMLSALTEEQEAVEVMHSSISKPLPADGQSSVHWELPTGVYTLSLSGNSSVVTARVVVRNLTIREGGEETYALPPSFAGKYTGEVKVGGTAGGTSGAGPLSFSLAESLKEGSLTDTQSIPLEGIKVDSNGTLTATAKYSGAAQPSYDQALTVQLGADGKTVEVKLTEIFPLDAELRAMMKRTSYRPAEWFRAGTLQREP